MHSSSNSGSSGSGSGSGSSGGSGNSSSIGSSTSYSIILLAYGLIGIAGGWLSNDSTNTNTYSSSSNNNSNSKLTPEFASEERLKRLLILFTFVTLLSGSLYNDDDVIKYPTLVMVVLLGSICTFRYIVYITRSFLYSSSSSSSSLSSSSSSSYSSSSSSSYSSSSSS